MERAPVALNEDERAALDRVVPPKQQAGDVIADLVKAAKEVWRRRQQNTVDGGFLLAALHRDAGSWRTIEYVTGIPFSTARRWATLPGATDAQLDEVLGQGEDES